MTEPREEETEEEATRRKAEHEQRMAEYQAEQQHKEDERKAEFDRQQKVYEAEQARREKQRKARVNTIERIIEAAATSFSSEQTRMFLRLLIQINPTTTLRMSPLTSPAMTRTRNSRTKKFSWPL